MLGGIWGCILFKLKEYTPRPPKKNSGGVSIPPPDPSYDQRKGCGPSFGNQPEGYGEFRLRRTLGRGMGAGGLWGFGGFRLVGDEGGEGLVVLAPGLGGYCPARGRGRHAVPRAWPPPTKFRAEIWGVGQGRRALRVGAGRLHQPPWTGFAAGAAWRPGGWWGPPVGEGSGMGAFVPRPPSSGNSKKGPGPLLGFRRSRRKESGSFFAAACTWRKILLTERRVKRVRPLWGSDPFRAKAEREAPPAMPEGPRPSCRFAARGRGNLKGRQRPPFKL